MLGILVNLDISSLSNTLNISLHGKLYIREKNKQTHGKSNQTHVHITRLPNKQIVIQNENQEIEIYYERSVN